MNQPSPTIRNRIGRLYRDLFGPFHYWLSLTEFRRLLPLEPTGKALWQMTRSYCGYGWFRDMSAWQIENEYCRMVDWVASCHPHIILEIGTAKGATLLAWSRIATQLVISVDLPGGIHGGGYPPVKEKLYRQFVSGRPGVRTLFYRGDSHSIETRDRVRTALRGKTVDFLFIDGDHTYAGVNRDFELWSQLVTPGGYIGFHDILPHRELKDCEVDRLWAELKLRHPNYEEIVEDPNQGWAGIGILKI